MPKQRMKPAKKKGAIDVDESEDGAAPESGDQTKWVLVGGSKRDASPDERKRFEEACYSLGVALAEAGFGIVAGSFESETADPHVLRGALRADPHLNALVIRPKSDKPESTFDDLRNIRIEDHPGSWATVRPEQVKKADAVVLIFGSEKGTGDLFRLANASEKRLPIVLVPAFGGFSAGVYEEYAHKYRYLKEQMSNESLRHLEVWSDQSPNTIVELLRRLLHLRATATNADDETDSQSRPQASREGPRSASSAPAETTTPTATYLLTWDPARTPFKTFTDTVLEIERSGPSLMRWNVGNSGAKNGSRVFLMRHGDDNPGLVGAGKVIGQITEGPYWDQSEPTDWKSFYAEVRWEVLQEMPLVPKAELIRETNETMLWTMEGSGLPIPPDVATRLEDVWLKARRLKHAPAVEPVLPRAYIESDAIPVIGWTRDHLLSKSDSLNVNEQAGIFATLLVAEEVEPPFAIGLLGDWGVGKTFFMRLMQEKIESIAGKKSEPAANTGCVPRAAQIEFNAWHYVDSDLWASLASHIFDGLSEELKGPTDKAAEIRLKLHQQIHSSKQGKQEADAAIAAAQTARQEATKKLQVKQAQRVPDAAIYESFRLKRVWEAVMRVRPDPNKPETWLGIAQGSALDLLAPFLQLVMLVGPAAAWASTKLTAISSALGYLEEIRDEIRTPRLELDAAGEEEKKIKEKIEKLDAEIATEQRRIEEADRQISQAQAQIQRINAGGLVYDFLDERARDARYLDKLGLISVIRRDFEELGGLLGDWSKHGAANGVKKSSAPNSPADPRPIGRIILYIDDLDRCPPQRVVEVLQAVHLLLAFDLFVVVVAVDARWLQRSLNEAYNSRPASQNDSPGQEPVHRFNAHNYLEKIFQIPFSVPTMEQAGFQKLITNMSATPRERAERHAQAANQGNPSEKSPTPTPGGAGFEAIVDARPRSSGDPARPGGEPGQSVDDESRTPDKLREQAEAERLQHEQEEAKERIAAVLLHDYEEQFVKALFPFIATPRLAKRFINIYRLFRVRAASQNDHFAKFIGRDTGEYRAVLVLLAISIGHAETAAEILDGLEPSEEDVQSWLKSRSSHFQKEHARLSEKPNAPGARGNRMENLQKAAETIASQMDKVETELALLKAPGLDKELKNYAAWAREVGRYSFGWRMD